MGLFDSIGSSFSNLGRKITKGIKRGTKGAVKGLKKAGFNKNFGRDFKKGFKMGAKALQAPQKFIESKDPLRKKMGDFGAFSPISLASSIALAPMTTTGFLEQLAVDDELQKKLKSGDTDTITELAFAPLSYIPAGGVGKSLTKSGAKAGIKAGSKRGARGAIKGISRMRR